MTIKQLLYSFRLQIHLGSEQRPKCQIKFSCWLNARHPWKWHMLMSQLLGVCLYD